MHEYLPLDAAGRRLNPPKSGATLRRWAKHGLRGCRLELRWEGGTPVTTMYFIAQFFDRFAAARGYD
jgi:hypothetical protein